MSDEKPKFITFEAREPIFSKGDEGDYLYFIRSGVVQIFVQDEKKEDIVLATLGENEIFGENALITDLPRSASARALSATNCMMISKQVLREKFQKSSSFEQLYLKSLIYHLNPKRG